MTQRAYRELATPIGTLVLVASDTHLEAVHFPGDGATVPPGARANAIVDEAARQLTEFFAGERRSFDLPLDPDGTDFQKSVWTALRGIPHGKTTSYGEIAQRIGKPTASRAVGAANGKNPIPIIIPCHRVIGRDGTLTGFGGGLPTKRALLDLELGTLDDAPR